MLLTRQVLRALLAPLCALAAGLLCVGLAWGQRRMPAESGGSLENMVTLGGWVHADYGQALPAGVTVRLETNEGMIGGQQTLNSAGYFEFLGLAKSYYRLTVTAPGFQTYQRDLDLRSVGDKLVMRVQLSPATKVATPSPPPAHSFTDDNASKKARREYERGVGALHDRNLNDAESHLEKAVKEYPCYARAQTDLAVALSARGKFPASEAALKKALACDPDYLDAYTELGQLLYLEKKYQESEAILLQGVRRSPQSWQFYYQLGADEYRLGHYPQAEENYRKAQSFNAAVPAEIHVKLADVYLKESAFDKAYAEMQAYVRAEPEGRFAAELRTVMRRMESDGILRAAQPRDAATPPPKP